MLQVLQEIETPPLAVPNELLRHTRRMGQPQVGEIGGDPILALTYYYCSIEKRLSACSRAPSIHAWRILKLSPQI